MPIFEPSQVPEPKSACTPVPSPIEAMIAAELDATGSVVTGWFHGFDAGKTGQPATVGDGAVAPAAETASRATSAAASFTNAPWQPSRLRASSERVIAVERLRITA